MCPVSTECSHIKKLNNTNLCVNTTNSNYIEKIYKKQVVLKKHSLQSDKVAFCVPIELTNSINMLFFFKIDLEPKNIKSIL